MQDPSSEHETHRMCAACFGAQQSVDAGAGAPLSIDGESSGGSSDSGGTPQKHQKEESHRLKKTKKRRRCSMGEKIKMTTPLENGISRAEIREALMQDAREELLHRVENGTQNEQKESGQRSRGRRPRHGERDEK